MHFKQTIYQLTPFRQVSMPSPQPGVVELDALGQVVRKVERRLGLALAVLVLGIAGVLLAGLGQPVFQYLAGDEITFAAMAEGAGCGSHLEWQSEARVLSPGSRARFVNGAGYWLIPVLIERRLPDGSYAKVAESPRLRDGESWSYTFWRDGEYRITSSEDVLRYAGLETTIAID